jgi:hypothetical protein
MTAPAALLRLAGLEKFVVPGKRYPAPLPPDLEACYCYTIDGGHSILVVLENVYREGEPVQGYLEPSVACPETGETKIGCVYEMVER